MKLPAKERVVSTAVVLGLAAVLIVVAASQYRWSSEVSEAASARMKASLQASLLGFRQDFYRELATLCIAFQPGQPPTPMRDQWARYAYQFQNWSRSTPHPSLVANVFILHGAGTNKPQLWKLNTATQEFEATEWPAEFQALRQRLEVVSPEMASIIGRFRRPPDERGPPPSGLFPGGFGERARFGGPWMVEQNLPALVHPLIARGPREEHTEPAKLESMDWLILELDGKVLEQHILPELAERYFSGRSGLEYDVAVIGGGPDGSRVVYSSDAGFAKSHGAGADGTINMFGMFPAPGAPPDGPLFIATTRAPQPGSFQLFHERHDMPRLETLRFSAQAREWQLFVKHRKGSLDAVVAGMRRRNLGFSFGVLLVLAATMAMVIIASQRAHRLARLQMDFVAGVSHELRTPLAVITSAAENIADGVIDTKQQYARYGKVIKKQAQQLNHLIEQILLFAGTRQNRVQYNLRPIAVRELIDAALSHTTELARAAGISIESDIAPDLPAVTGDLSALSHCLQNLITNAVKYGGPDRWIGIRASRDHDYVNIGVDDHGAGIAPSELPHIFEPFYRSPAVTAAQIHGTGLGLTLARSIAEAMGGELNVTSEPGNGTSFTLRLRVAEEAIDTDITATVAAGSNSTPSDGA